jgi:hypothetical protein
MIRLSVALLLEDWMRGESLFEDLPEQKGFGGWRVGGSAAPRGSLCLKR